MSSKLVFHTKQGNETSWPSRPGQQNSRGTQLATSKGSNMSSSLTRPIHVGKAPGDAMGARHGSTSSQERILRAESFGTPASDVEMCGPDARPLGISKTVEFAIDVCESSFEACSA